MGPDRPWSQFCLPGRSLPGPWVEHGASCARSGARLHGPAAVVTPAWTGTLCPPGKGRTASRRGSTAESPRGGLPAAPMQPAPGTPVPGCATVATGPLRPGRPLRRVAAMGPDRSRWGRRCPGARPWALPATGRPGQGLSCSNGRPMTVGSGRAFVGPASPGDHPPACPAGHPGRHPAPAVAGIRGAVPPRGAPRAHGAGPPQRHHVAAAHAAPGTGADGACTRMHGPQGRLRTGWRRSSDDRPVRPGLSCGPASPGVHRLPRRPQAPLLRPGALAARGLAWRPSARRRAGPASAP